MDIAGDNGRLLLRLMSAATLRAEVTANNLANQNTPGFKRQTVAFEDLLLDKLQKGESDLGAVEPGIFTDTLSPSNADGNNVTMELEQNTMTQNRVMFETYATILAGQLELVRAAIEERG